MSIQWKLYHQVVGVKTDRINHYQSIPFYFLNTDTNWLLNKYKYIYIIKNIKVHNIYLLIIVNREGIKLQQ